MNRLLLFLLCTFSFSLGDYTTATVYIQGDAFAIKKGVFDRAHGIAVAKYDQDAVNTTGWATLYISTKTSKQTTTSNRGYAAGLLEGFLSYELMWDAYLNWLDSSLPPSYNGKLPSSVEGFMMTQKQWMHSEVAKNPTSDYWQHVDVLLQQVNGMQDGYNQAQQDPKKKLTLPQVYMLTMAGDLEDLLLAFPNDQGRVVANEILARKKQQKGLAPLHMDCSGLVKVLPDWSNVFIGHSTFNGYWCMLRIFKHYEIPLSDISGAATVTSFSSRPGDLESKDDFYLMDTGLAVIETSLATINRELYQYLSPQSVPCWLRSQLANRLAKTSPDWVSYFSTLNSGTHNNEWIVLDFKNFIPKPKRLLPNTAWMLDQMGPYIDSADVTYTLLEKELFIPSFNIPYFPFIFNVSGYAAAGFNYDADIRHLIFQRDHSKVTDVKSMGWLMNSNDYQHDPLSQGSPCNAISARCDLAQPASSASAFGGIDSKVADVSLGTSQKIFTVGGQTHQTQPPFSFSPQWTSVAHRGMPILWNFDWGIMQVPPDTEHDKRKDVNVL